MKAGQPDRFSLKRLKHACSECSVHDLCLPLGLNQPDMERLEGLVERVSSFLLDWSARPKIRGYAANHLNLSMSRRDLANYLSLAPETVSRVFRRFQNEGLFSVDRRELRLLEPERLRTV